MLTFDVRCPECGAEFQVKEFPYMNDYMIHSLDAICPKCGCEFEYELSEQEKDAWRDDYIDNYSDVLEKEWNKTLPKVFRSLDRVFKLFELLEVDLNKDEEAKEKLKEIVESYLEGKSLYEKLTIIREVMEEYT